MQLGSLNLILVYKEKINLTCICIYLYIGYIYIYIYIYGKSASRFSRGTVLNTFKQSRINIMRGKKGTQLHFPTSLFRESLHFENPWRVKRLETGLSGNVVASLFPSHNIFLYIHCSITTVQNDWSKISQLIHQSHLRKL